jgi:hypothetical protein
MNKLIFLLSCLFLQSCAYSIHQVYSSNVDKKVALSKSKIVEVTKKQHVILSLVTQTDYINEAHQALVEKCPNGEIQGITTKHSTDLGFLSWYNIVTMRGLCL